MTRTPDGFWIAARLETLPVAEQTSSDTAAMPDTCGPVRRDRAMEMLGAFAVLGLLFACLWLTSPRETSAAARVWRETTREWRR